MGILQGFESRMEKAFEGGGLSRSQVTPVQISKRAEREMNRNKLVSAGRQHAPTLYNVLLSPADDDNLWGYYPTLSGEIETYLRGKAYENGLHMDGRPLVRFIVDDGLKPGKFDVIAEVVSGNIIAQLREEELDYYASLAGDKRDAPAADDDEFDAGPQGQGDSARISLHPQPLRHAANETADAEDAPHESPARDAQYAKAAKPAAPASLVPETIMLDRANPRGARDVTDAASLRPAASLLNQETGEVWQLEGMRVSLGRDRNMQIPLRDANVSRSHAELIYDNGRWILRDLGSTNGSFINGQRVGQMELKDGDIIELGVTVLEFREDQL